MHGPGATVPLSIGLIFVAIGVLVAAIANRSRVIRRLVP